MGRLLEKAAEYEQNGQVLVIRPQKDLDHHYAIQLRREADNFIEQGLVLNLLFDFSDVHFMDSSGIGVIMGRYKKIIFQGGRIACCCVGKEVDRILTVSGLYRIMPCYKKKEDALQAFREGKHGGE